MQEYWVSNSRFCVHEENKTEIAKKHKEKCWLYWPLTCFCFVASLVTNPLQWHYSLTPYWMRVDSNLIQYKHYKMRSYLWYSHYRVIFSMLLCTVSNTCSKCPQFLLTIMVKLLKIDRDILLSLCSFKPHTLTCFIHL